MLEFCGDPVVVEELRKNYGRVEALRGISFSVPEGSVFGLLGPNGAGKTTALRILTGLARPTAGRAFVLGKDPANPAVRGPGMCGALVDEPAFYPFLSGRENLRLLAQLGGVDGRLVDEALEAVGLSGVADRPYAAYSHGMRQRLGVASALLGRPRLLVLDEPASGLDPAGIRHVRELLREFAGRGGTVLLSSHLLQEVEQLCTHVALIFGGRIVACGELEELLGAGRLLRLRARPVDKAVEVLRARGLEPQVEGEEIVGPWGEMAERVNRWLVEAGVDVGMLVAERPSLESLYLRFTGGKWDVEGDGS